MFVTVIKRQNKLIWLPKNVEINGICTSQLTMASYVERSLAQRKLSWRNSMADGKNIKSAMRIGICSNIGIQPLIGLAPALL